MGREHIMGREVLVSGKRTHYGKGGVSGKRTHHGKGGVSGKRTHHGKGGVSELKETDPNFRIRLKLFYSSVREIEDLAGSPHLLCPFLSNRVHLA